MPPPAEILTIGDELCRGEVVDTNSAWLAERLTLLGLRVRWRTSTTDDVHDMEAALRTAAGRARVVVCSGGLGPTADDRTVDVLAAIHGVAPVIEASHRARMERRFAERHFEVTPNNLRQVRIPEGASVLDNHVGLAPGFHFEVGDAGVFALPGVPREMQPMFEQAVEPRLRELFGEAGRESGATARRTWRVAAMGESHVDHRLRGLLDGIDGASMHFRIVFPENLVTVVVHRESRAAADAAIEMLDGAMKERLGDHLYGIDDETLAQAVGRRLGARGETLVTAESCTGGLIADMVTAVAGSSAYFRGGVVAYSDELKRTLLGVSPATIERHGAVSEACVAEMALGASDRIGGGIGSWGLAVSGIAGPDGGTADKPVGLVHFAVAAPMRDGGASNPAAGGDQLARVAARRLTWPGSRRMVKQMAASAALFLLYRQLAR